MILRYGIISCASITDRFLHGILENHDTIEAIASRNLSKAQEKAKQFSIPKAYGTYEQVYQDPNVDIVYISNNNANHVKEVKQALSYKKHVICEKPIALHDEDAKNLFYYARKQGCFLMEAQKSIFLPVIQDIHQIIQQGQLGTLHQVSLSSSFPNPDVSWMHDPLQGGVIYGSANYTIELLDYLLQPKTIHVSALGTKEENGTCDRVSISMLMDQVLISSRISMKGDTKKEAIFYFTNGYVEVPTYWKAREYRIVQKDHVKRILYPCTYEMKYEVAHIHECIEQGLLESPMMSAQRSILCTQLVDTMMASI